MVARYRVPTLLENQGKLENHIKFTASQENSGKVREVFCLEGDQSGKIREKVFLKVATLMQN